jgi:uncharacterized membrane protein
VVSVKFLVVLLDRRLSILAAADSDREWKSQPVWLPVALLVSRVGSAAVKGECKRNLGQLRNSSMLITFLALFGIPGNVFWPYFAGITILAIGAFALSRTMLDAQSSIQVVAGLFIAIPSAVFGADHFVAPTEVARIVPTWMPAHLFWVYFVGAALLAAALSVITRRHSELASTLLGIMIFSFVLLIHMPKLISHPGDRFALAVLLRDISFSGGAIALAFSQRAERGASNSNEMLTVLRVAVGTPAIVFGFEHFLHPEFVPVVPLKQPLPSWFPVHTALSCAIGSILIICGISLILNRKARFAAKLMGFAVFAVVLLVYLPLLISNPNEELNYFADTLLFSGSALALAAALATEPVGVCANPITPLREQVPNELSKNEPSAAVSGEPGGYNR